MNFPARQTIRFDVGGTERSARVSASGRGRFSVTIDSGVTLDATATLTDGKRFTCTVGDRTRVDTVVLIKDGVHLFGPDGEVRWMRMWLDGRVVVGNRKS